MRRELRIEGRTVVYEESGEGEPLLLFHAFPLSREAWWPQLERAPEGARIIAPDLRGFGDSEPSLPFSIDDLSADALKLMDALKLETAFIGGCSMGGYVALGVLRLDPGRVKGLLLVDTQCTADDEAKKKSREETATQLEKGGSEALVTKMLPQMVKGPVARVERIMRAQRPAVMAAASRAMGARPDSTPYLARFAGPCAIVTGSDDEAIPTEKSKQMHGLVTGSTLHELDGAKHLSNLDQPEPFARIVTALCRGTCHPGT